MFIRPTVCLAFVAIGSAHAFATPNLVTNGDFETLTNGSGEIAPGRISGTYITSAPGWYSTSTTANGGYPFLFFTSNAVTTGFNDAWDNGVQYLYGSSNGGQNGNAWNGTSSVGGNYLVANGDYHATAISQNISGLIAGTSYTLTFSWAAAQVVNNTVATNETWGASLGGQTFSTPTYHLPSQGFSGWMSQTIVFNYDGSSNVLSFLASGTPSGQSPTLLLDGVSLTAVPEPGPLVLAAAVVAAVSLSRRRRTVRRDRGAVGAA